MTSCATCLDKLRISRDHGGAPCPVRASLWCSQCSCRGHDPSTCDAVLSHLVERPATLEDIIRRVGGEDELERWGLTKTSHYILHRSPKMMTLEEMEKEIADSNTIEVVYRDGKQDSRIREVMRTLKIATVHKMDDNIHKLRTWAVANGKKVRLVQER